MPEHIVDQFIVERLGNLLKIPGLSPLMLEGMKPVMRYWDARNIIDDMGAEATGHKAMQRFTHEINPNIEIEGAENIPTEGSGLVLANHPSGICDGLVLHEVVHQVRQDFMLMANLDAIRAVPPLEDVIMPVEWRKEHRTYAQSRSTTLAYRRAIKEGKLLLIFPSGRLAYKNKRGELVERTWNNTAVRLAQKHKLPIYPVHIESSNSRLFYLVSKVSERIRDVTVMREAFNKRRQRYPIKFGAPIMPECVVGDDSQAITDRIQNYVTSGFTEPLQLPMKPAMKPDSQ